MIEDPVQKIGRPRQLYIGNKKTTYGKKRSTKKMMLSKSVTKESRQNV
jgi:hypothetical protein